MNSYKSVFKVFEETYSRWVSLSRCLLRLALHDFIFSMSKQ